MVDAPERIWIEHGDECPYFYEEDELHEAGSAITEYVRADVAAARVRAEDNAGEPVGYACTGCGRLTKDPKADFAALRERGALSCCPERNMQPVSYTHPAPQPSRMVKALADKYCEGWCKESGGQGKFGDCVGCEILSALMAGKPEQSGFRGDVKCHCVCGKCGGSGCYGTTLSTAGGGDA